MSDYYIWEGRAYELDRSDLTSLSRCVMFHANKILTPTSHMLQQDFDRHRTWRSDIYGFDVVYHALRGLKFPKIARINSLKRTEARLRRYANSERAVLQFFDHYPRWAKQVSRLRSDMNAYRSAYFGDRAVIARKIELTRDGAFITLQVLAGIATGGTSAVASTGLRAGMTVLGRQVAMGIMTSAINRQAKAVCRTMAGETVTTSDTANDLMAAGIDGMAGPLLGRIFNPWIDRIIGPMGDWAKAEIEAGRLIRGVSLTIADSQLQNLIQDCLSWFVTSAPNELRVIIKDALKERDESAAARRAMRALTNNRRFRGRVDQHLMRAATR